MDIFYNKFFNDKSPNSFGISFCSFQTAFLMSAIYEADKDEDSSSI